MLTPHKEYSLKAAATTAAPAVAAAAAVAVLAAAAATVVVIVVAETAVVVAVAAAATALVVAAAAAAAQGATIQVAEGQLQEQAATPCQIGSRVLGLRLLVWLPVGLQPTRAAAEGAERRGPSCADVEALTGALQKVTVDGGEMEMAAVEESLSSSERAVVLRLKQLQEEHAALSAVFEAAVLRLKLEYEEKYKPLYQKRLEALTPAPTEEQAADKTPVGTPANRLLADIIEEQDEEPLSYLRNIECEWVSPSVELGSSPPAKAEAGGGAPHPESFRLVFTFTENPFFEPLTLVKEYRLSTVPGGRGAELTSTKSTQIKWRPDKDVTKKTVIRKQRNRKTKQTRTVAETVDANSFFNLFVDHEVPSDDKLEQMEEKEVEELQMVVEADYDIGITIRDKIIPRAVDWFLGQVDDDSDFEDYDLNDEDFDSEESDEDEDSSDDEPPRHSKGAAKATIGAESGGPDQKPDGFAAAAAAAELHQYANIRVSIHCNNLRPILECCLLIHLPSQKKERERRHEFLCPSQTQAVFPPTNPQRDNTRSAAAAAAAGDGYLAPICCCCALLLLLSRGSGGSSSCMRL
ncbi:hypothetical protein Emag_005646 [Eimeria magna]